jgi:hypothetical protein
MERKRPATEPLPFSFLKRTGVSEVRSAAQPGTWQSGIASSPLPLAPALRSAFAASAAAAGAAGTGTNDMAFGAHA